VEDAPALRLVYEVGRDSWQDFLWLLPGLLVTLAGLKAIIDPTFFWRGHAGTSWSITLSWLFFLFAFFGFIWTSWITISNYRELSSALRNGSCRSVEGVVEDLQPIVHGERFVVDGVPFSYKDHEISGGFRNSRSYVEENLYVRICYVRRPGPRSKNTILRLETAASPS
jgi:hypothetical protein